MCAKPIIYYVSGTIFPRRPAPGRVSLERCANFTFSFFVFSFWPLFFILFFGLSDVLDSYQITAFGSRRPNLWPSLGGLRGARGEPFCPEKTMVFAYFHENWLRNQVRFRARKYATSIVFSMQIGSPCLSQRGSQRRLSNSQKLLLGPLERLWGPRATFGDHLWIVLVASSVLEALWGPFLMHLGLLQSSF